MAHQRPWYKRNGGDFVMATLGFPDAETKWAYSAIIDMLNDRDRPLPDDPAFICGFTGLSRKKWALVRRYLLETPSSNGDAYLLLTGTGDLTNSRFERERVERADTRLEARASGSKGGKASAARRAVNAPVTDDRAQKQPESMPESTPESTMNGAPKVQAEPSKNSDLAEANPQAPCARQSTDKIYTHHDSPRDTVEAGGSGPGDASPQTPAPSRLDDKNLQALFDAVCDAAGFNPIMPDAINRAYRQVQAWRDADINFDTVVVPTIKAAVASSEEPTRLLSRFDKAVRHQHARLKARGEQGQTYRPPASPVLEVKGELPTITALRADMLKVLGNASYCALMNDVVLEVVTDAGVGRTPLRVVDRRPPAVQLMNSPRADTLRSLAQRHGFTDVW